MRVHCVLNRDSGGLKTTNIKVLIDTLKKAFSDEGHDISIAVLRGREMNSAIEDAANGNYDALIAVGGDGTVSSAAAKLVSKSMALGILPGGTMNLFARSLGIPFDLEKAAQALAKGKIEKVDTASLNGRVFILHFSIGLHPHLVRKRIQMNYQSRLQKMYASFRAALLAFSAPPNLQLDIELDERRLASTTPAFSVSNNIYGEGHLPYADQLDKGVLGIYICKAQRRYELFKLGLDILLGRWQSGGGVEVLSASKAVVKVVHVTKTAKIILDGELLDMPDKIEIVTRPGSLNVLKPATGD